MIFPLLAFGAVAGQARDWASRNLTETLANYGVSAPPNVYASVPSSMKKAPANLPEAYAQAVYWLSLAARRADYDAARNPSLRNTQMDIWSRQQRVSQEGDILLSDISWVCSYLGYGCPQKGSEEVLEEAAALVQGSRLGDADKTKIAGQLRQNASALRWKKFLPLLGVAGAGFLAYKGYKKLRS